MHTVIPVLRIAKSSSVRNMAGATLVVMLTIGELLGLTASHASVPPPLLGVRVMLPVQLSDKGYLQVQDQSISIEIPRRADVFQVGDRLDLIQKNQLYYVAMAQREHADPELVAVRRIRTDGQGTAWVTQQKDLIFGIDTYADEGRFYLRPTEILAVLQETEMDYLVLCERNDIEFALAIPKDTIGLERLTELPPLVAEKVRQRDLMANRVILEDEYLDASLDPTGFGETDLHALDPLSRSGQGEAVPASYDPQVVRDPALRPLRVATLTPAIQPPDRSNTQALPSTQEAPTIAPATAPVEPAMPAVGDTDPFPPPTMAVERPKPAMPDNRQPLPVPPLAEPAALAAVTDDSPDVIPTTETAPQPAIEAAPTAVVEPQENPSSPPADSVAMPPTPVGEDTSPSSPPQPTTEDAAPATPPQADPVPAVPAVPPMALAEVSPAESAEDTREPNPIVASNRPTPEAELSAVAAAVSPSPATNVAQAAIRILLLLLGLTAIFLFGIFLLAKIVNRPAKPQKVVAKPRSRKVPEPPAPLMPAPPPIPTPMAETPSPAPTTLLSVEAAPDPDVLPDDPITAFADASSKSGSFSGSLDGFHISELVQFLHSSRETGILTLSNHQGPHTSQIMFCDGEIFQAAQEELKAEAAVRSIMQLESGFFVFARQDTPTFEQEIKQSTMSLMMSLHQEQDEKGVESTPTPDATTPPAPSPNATPLPATNLDLMDDPFASGPLPDPAAMPEPAELEMSSEHDVALALKQSLESLGDDAELFKRA